MKYTMSMLSIFLRQRGAKRNIKHLLRFIFLLLSMIALYSVIFHYIMAYEERDYSWITGIYWTMTVMTTLGFGDITFTSDLGKLFSILVMLTGVICLLVMLPFMFIQYFYEPWLEAQKDRSARRELPAGMTRHVVIVGISPSSLNLIDDLKHHGFECVLISDDTNQALELLDLGYQCIVGAHDLTTTYTRVKATQASMILALDSDVRNTSVAFTVRAVAKEVPLVARVENVDSIDILELSGATYVLQFHKMLGESLARRVIGRDSYAGEIGNYGELVLAEAISLRTHLVGKTLRQADLRKSTGVNIVGIWDRGVFSLPSPDTVITNTGVLVIAGTQAQIDAFNHHVDKHKQDIDSAPNGTVLILGGGRVGIAAAYALEERGLPYCIIDKSKRYNEVDINYMQGDAADITVLEKAGLANATSVLITTHDDDTNIYLTIYCRRLRPDIQIISRSTLDRNIGILHSAGADLVMSLVSIMTNAVLNLLSPGKIIMLHEGLSLFKSPVTPELIGKNLMESKLRENTNTSVVAIETAEEKLIVNPDPKRVFLATDILLLVGKDNT